MDKKIMSVTVHNGVTLDGTVRNSFTAVANSPNAVVHLKSAKFELYGVTLIGYKSSVFVPFTNIPYVTLVNEEEVKGNVKKS